MLDSHPHSLAAIGLYGVMSYLVAQRTQEIGTRIALGAGRSNVLALVLRQSIGLVTTGIVLGIAGAVPLAGVMQKLLFETETRDTLTFSAVPVVLPVVARVATLLPARRATLVDPIEALRCE